jgi:hypothetical protein
MGEPEISFSPAGEPQKESHWIPMAIGAAVVAAVVVAFIIFGRSGPSAVPTQVDPYAAKLQIGNLHMATAENFAGGSVTYILGTIANTGDKKVTGLRVEVLFKNSLNETAQKETLPLMALLPNTPYVDYGTLDRAPLVPGQRRDFRLTLEHVSSDWDGQLPAVRVISVSY